MTPDQITALLPAPRPFNWFTADYTRADLRKLRIFSEAEISGDAPSIIAKLELHHSSMVEAARVGAYWRCNSHLIALKIALAGERQGMRGAA